MVREGINEFLFGGKKDSDVVTNSGRAQAVPVNVYETDNDVVVAAPMPGVEADDIDIEVVGRTVTLRSGMRGPHQEDRAYAIHQWSYGPYYCSVELPMEVDAQFANASHGNGVLVVALPKSQRARTVRVPLRQEARGQAMHRGHSGQGTEPEGC